MGVEHTVALPQILPRLVSAPYIATSDWTRSYNCIAWAALDETKWWWPIGRDYWPPGIPKQLTVEAFTAAFAGKGYEPCDSFVHEAGLVKLALYVDAFDRPLHMARQLPDGRWTSKLGRLWDITHSTLEQLCGGVGPNDYGVARYAFRRPAQLDRENGGE